MISKSVCYFPYTDLSPARLTRALMLFKKIIIHRLPDSQMDDHLMVAQEKGWLEMVPADFIGDVVEIRSILNDFTSWAAQFRDPRYMAAMKTRLQEEQWEESGAGLIGQIRRGLTGRGVDKDPDREAQIFLHFAQELDRSQTEIRDLLSETLTKENLLGEIMGVEGADELSDFQGTMPLSAEEEPGLALLPQRLAAWGRVYAAFNPVPAPFFTDQPEAVFTLDLNLARRKPSREMNTRPTEVLELLFDFRLPVRPLSAEPAVPWQELTAWRRSERTDWFDFIDRLSARAWPVKALAGLKQEAAALAAETRSPDESFALTVSGYMLPGENLKEAYLSAAGLKPFDPTDISLFSGPVFCISPAG